MFYRAWEPYNHLSAVCPHRETIASVSLLSLNSMPVTNFVFASIFFSVFLGEREREMVLRWWAVGWLVMLVWSRESLSLLRQESKAAHKKTKKCCQVLHCGFPVALGLGSVCSPLLQTYSHCLLFSLHTKTKKDLTRKKEIDKKKKTHSPITKGGIVEHPWIV